MQQWQTACGKSCDLVQQTINSIWGVKCGSVRRSGEWMEALLYQWKTVSLYHNINTPRLLNTSSYIRKQLNHFQLSVFEIRALSSDLRNALWQNQGVFLWKFNEFFYYFLFSSTGSCYCMSIKVIQTENVGELFFIKKTKLISSNWPKNVVTCVLDNSKSQHLLLI